MSKQENCLLHITKLLGQTLPHDFTGDKIILLKQYLSLKNFFFLFNWRQRYEYIFLKKKKIPIFQFFPLQIFFFFSIYKKMVQNKIFFIFFFMILLVISVQSVESPKNTNGVYRKYSKYLFQFFFFFFFITSKF